jgi:hypothetical protein
LRSWLPELLEHNFHGQLDDLMARCKRCHGTQHSGAESIRLLALGRWRYV